MRYLQGAASSATTKVGDVVTSQNKQNDEAFERRLSQSDSALGPHQQRLERNFNEEEPNLLKLRQDVSNAIAVERQLEMQIKNRRRKQFESAESDPELEQMEANLAAHQKIKDSLKAQLTEREQRLQHVYDEKPGLIMSFIKDPKNVFVIIVVLVILNVLHKLL